MTICDAEEFILQSCRYLKGVGPAVAEKLEKLKIFTIQDILFHLPLRYEDRTRLTPISVCSVGQSVLIEGEIVSKTMPIKTGTRLLLKISDGTGIISVRFFHWIATQFAQFKIGTRLRCFGEVRMGPHGFEMAHPECYCVESGAPLEDRLTPVYPTTQGLSQFTFRRLTAAALSLLSEKTVPDYLTQVLIQTYRWPTLSDALHYVHRPPVNAMVQDLLRGTHITQKRLAFEELLAHRLALLKRRNHYRQVIAPALFIDRELENKITTRLPFSLTRAQRRVLEEIYQDLSQPKPMLRLLQGDVGSGKTIVSALVALQVVMNGYQVAVMAPTEILAEQHRAVMQSWFSEFSFSVGYLVGSLSSKEKREQLDRLKIGKDSIVVGTHALFQEPVIFSKLGFILVDEQHRFGVEQRFALRDKGYAVHQLMMTATPIPRTLAMTAYADLDLSLLDELPQGRKPIKTVLLSNQRRHEVIERIEAVCKQGAQVYWVCTLIEESLVLTANAAEETKAELSTLLPNITIGLLHGRMKAIEKEETMRLFKKGDIQLLIATTVIEVGVDVPNATLMVIDNAERLGLSQLHQLRGRVGRGQQESFCVLLYDARLSSEAKLRLQVMRDCQDGFVLSEKDLEIRGPGEVLGTRQSGEIQFRVANLLRDRSLLETVQSVAAQLDEVAANGLIQRWLGKSLHYQSV